MRLVRDVDVVLDPERGRVGDYDREAVVRIFREYEFRSLIDRLPPLTGERPEDAVLAMRGLRDAGFPAAQGAGRGARRSAGLRAVRADPPGRPRSVRRTGPCSCRWTSTWFGGGGGRGAGRAVEVRAAPSPGSRATSPAVEARAEALAAATGDLPGALAAAIVDPGRIEVADEARVATLEPWLREQDAVGVALVVDDPRPLAGTPLSIAVAGADGRVVAADGAAASDRAAAPAGAPGHAARRPRGQAAAHRAVRGGAGRGPDPGRVRHPDRRLPRQRRAPGPEDRRRGRGAARPRPAAHRRGPATHRHRRPRGPVRPRRASLAGGRAPRRGCRAPVRRDRAPPGPDPGADGGRGDRPGPRRAVRPRARVRHGDRTAGDGDLRRRRPRVHDRLAQAAGRDPVRGAGAAQGPQDQDRLLHRRDRAGGAARRPPGGPAGPGLAHLHEAALDVRGGAAER